MMNRNPTASLSWLSILAVVLVGMMGASLVIIIQQGGEESQRALDQSKANNAIIKEIRGDLFVHAHASADRVCSIAQELRYLVDQTPDLKQRIHDHVAEFTKNACLFVPPHVSYTGSLPGEGG